MPEVCLAEKVGFVPSRDEPARRAMPEDHPTAKAERSEELAERVGFGLRPRVENKELSGIPLPPDPLEPLKRRGRRT